MIIIIEDEDLEMAVEGIFQGKYKKYKSNQSFKTEFNRVIQRIRAVQNYSSLVCYKSLACEALTGDRAGTYSMRMGFRAKERLIYTLQENEIYIKLIEISDHYGDH